MMDIQQFCDWLQAQAFAVAIGESPWLFPAIETVHVVALALVVGSIAMIDLRLLGWSQNGRTASDVIAQLLPVTWSAFAFAVATGTLMFSTNAAKYYVNLPFRLKMTCLLLAGVKLAFFSIALAATHRGLGYRHHANRTQDRRRDFIVAWGNHCRRRTVDRIYSVKHALRQFFFREMTR